MPATYEERERRTDRREEEREEERRYNSRNEPVGLPTYKKGNDLDDFDRREERRRENPEREEWHGPELALEVIEFRLEQIKQAMFPYRPDIIEHAANDALHEVDMLEQWLHGQPPGRFNNIYPPSGGTRNSREIK